MLLKLTRMILIALKHPNFYFLNLLLTIYHAFRQYFKISELLVEKNAHTQFPKFFDPFFRDRFSRKKGSKKRVEKNAHTH